MPLPNAPAEVPLEPELVLLLQHLDELPVTVNDIRKWTKCDPLLAQVLQFVEREWSHKCDSSLTPYSSRSTELSVLDGCILWGSRVVIPPQGQQAVLQELHAAQGRSRRSGWSGFGRTTIFKIKTKFHFTKSK